MSLDLRHMDFDGMETSCYLFQQSVNAVVLVIPALLQILKDNQRNHDGLKG